MACELPEATPHLGVVLERALGLDDRLEQSPPDDDRCPERSGDLLVIEVALPVEVSTELEEAEDRVGARVVGHVERAVPELERHLESRKDQLVRRPAAVDRFDPLERVRRTWALS